MSDTITINVGWSRSNMGPDLKTLVIDKDNDKVELEFKLSESESVIEEYKITLDNPFNLSPPPPLLVRTEDLLCTRIGQPKSPIDAELIKLNAYLFKKGAYAYQDPNNNLLFACDALYQIRQLRSGDNNNFLLNPPDYEAHGGATHNNPKFME